MLAIQIGLMGAGRMATALARGLVQTGIVPPESIVASDPSEDARRAFAAEVPGTTVAPDIADQVAKADVIFLAVKPQQMSAALAALRGSIRADGLVVSIAAGITLERIAAALPAGQRIVRVMPNTPCLIGQGASGFSSRKTGHAGGRQTGGHAAFRGGGSVRSARNHAGCRHGPLRVRPGIRV